MGQRVTQVDAFTAEPFGGNPAAVCVLEEPREEGWMKAVAVEMNLSETAFLRPREDGTWELRWFTPAVEVDLCGHATLASAHVLWEEGLVRRGDEIRFSTRSGTLAARIDGEWIQLDFPAEPVVPAPLDPGLAAALGAEPVFCGRNRLDVFVELASEDVLRSLAPDFRVLAEVEARGLIVTSPPAAPGRFDFLSRYFAPACGIDEDPVTGSAHCALGPYWSGRLGREELVGFQASARGGVVRTRVAGDRLLLGGRAVTVLRGELLV